MRHPAEARERGATPAQVLLVLLILGLVALVVVVALGRVGV